MLGVELISKARKERRSCTPRIIGSAASITVPVEAVMPVRMLSAHLYAPNAVPNRTKQVPTTNSIEAREKSRRK
jgi:hypothetical protein